MNETDFDHAWNGRRLAAFRRQVARWFSGDGRDLPWRKTRDAYHVWISEIMLQQTTVAAVVPYFQRFLQRFPDVDTLADADERDVLRMWEGLGYYSRARNIHRTAKIVASERAGEFPNDVAELQKLPGIGRYTAGAIASFAFDRPAPIVEANTLRLYCRLLGYDGDPRSAAGMKTLWAFAERIVPANNPGEFNHALMDLGATVCRIADPRCSDCPVKRSCRAFAENRVDQIPTAATRPAIVPVTEAAVVVRKGGLVLLRQCEPGERWAGLWDFPRFELARNHEPPPPESARRIEELLARQTGIEADVESLMHEIRHSVTRYRIRLLCYAARHTGGARKRSAPLRWASANQLDDFPLSVSGRKIARLIAGGKPRPNNPAQRKSQ